MLPYEAVPGAQFAALNLDFGSLDSRAIALVVSPD
jgi:hypothetical protein